MSVVAMDSARETVRSRVALSLFSGIDRLQLAGTAPGDAPDDKD